MLKVRLLGQFDVRRDGAVIAIPSRAAQSLLAYLLLTTGTIHRREKLAGLFWPDTSEENARKSLRHELWRLRQAIEIINPRKKIPPYLTVDEISVGFNAESNYWLDVAVVHAPLTKHVSADQLIETLSNYRGELLPGMYEDWIVLERERVRAVFEQKMSRLLELLVQEKRWQDILDWGERWISFGQSPEPAYRALMLAHNAKGDKAKVALTYQRCVTALQNDLNVMPSQETQALFERLSKSERVAMPSMTAEIKSPVSMQPSRGSNLPVPLTSFVGREKELKEIARQLSSSRLVTLTGPGGVGKTRLAIQTVKDAIDQFKDDVWWIELAPLMDAKLVPQTVAQVVGVRESPSQSLIETLKNFIADKELLLILDNCEHLIAACAQLANALLSQCAHLRILATSREPLGITGEVLHQVPTLSLPDTPRLTLVDLLMKYESIRLFVERACAVKSDFALDERNAATVLAICRRLDGIPLALELAAARTRVLTVEYIAERLNRRFDLLTQGSRTALPRQQTLRAAIDWSFDLLPDDVRLLFQRLSVFAGGFTLEAAEEICSDAPLVAANLLGLLTQLVDRSLVNVERQGRYDRYRMLETIREYAREKLDATGETESMRWRHRDFFIAFAEQAAPKLKGGEQFQWLDRLELEHDNLRAAWECAIASDAALALRLASALFDFWYMLETYSEGRVWLAKLIEQTNQWGQTAGRAHVLSMAGWFAAYQRDLATARQLLEEGLAVARSVDAKREIAFALLGLGATAYWQRDDPIAESFTGEALTIYQELQDDQGIALAMLQLPSLSSYDAESEELLLQSLAKFRELGDRFRMGRVLNDLGELTRLRDDYERAGAFYEQALEIRRELRSRISLATTLFNLAWVWLHRGNYGKAKTLLEESLKLKEEHNAKVGMLLCLGGFAGILGMIGKPEQGARLFGALESLLESRGMAGRLEVLDQKEINHYVAAVREQLDEAAFTKAWAEGRGMTIEQAIAYALQT